MLGLRLVRLIERHSAALSRGLTEQILNSERTSDFRKVPAKDLQLAATEVYRDLGEWLLQKTERDIATRFRAIAARRASEGIGLHQLVWALMLTRDHLWQFLQREAFADNVVELHGELELHQQLNQFFDRAIYYAILGYHEPAQSIPKNDLRRARDLAVSIGLMSPPSTNCPDRDQ
jgi:hypothetical protein